MKTAIDEEFYKKLYRVISDEAREYCPTRIDEKVIELNFELDGIDVEADIDANVELIDDSFSHEFGLERCFHLALGEINTIKCRCHDSEGDIAIDDSRLNFYLNEEKRLVEKNLYHEAFCLTQ